MSTRRLGVPDRRTRESVPDRVPASSLNGPMPLPRQTSRTRTEARKRPTR